MKLSLVIPSGQTDSVLITFSPDITPGDLVDTLEMVTDDLDNSNGVLVLAFGTSSWPVLAIEHTYLSFGDVNVIDYKTMSVLSRMKGMIHYLWIVYLSKTPLPVLVSLSEK